MGVSISVLSDLDLRCLLSDIFGYFRPSSDQCRSRSASICVPSDDNLHHLRLDLLGYSDQEAKRIDTDTMVQIYHRI
jgi:hypothetical protein